MNRQLLKKIYWFFMGIIPRKGRLKLNLALHCLTGNWDFAVNAYLFSAPFAALEEAEISRRLAGLDDNSLAVARNYVRRCRNLERIKGSPFADGSRVLIDLDALKEHIMCFPSPHAELKTYQKIYGFKTGAEVLIYQHGLVFFRQQISGYVKDRVFIDAGACIGELIPALLEYFPRKIYAFEPSRVNGERFIREMKKRGISQERVELVRAGLGKEEGLLALDDCGGSGQMLTEEGKDRCRIMALDDFVSEKNISSVGLIKADVEGMGLELLKGAIGTIRRDRPVLSLAAYHNVDELLGQYAYLSSELENYHFELRDLPPGSSFEVTLLGIPEEILR